MYLLAAQFLPVERGHERRCPPNPRQFDREHAADARYIANIDPPVIRFRAPPAEGQAETEASSIGTELLERMEQRVDVTAWQPAAFVLNMEADLMIIGVNT